MSLLLNVLNVTEILSRGDFYMSNSTGVKTTTALFENANVPEFYILGNEEGYLEINILSKESN